MAAHLLASSCAIAFPLLAASSESVAHSFLEKGEGRQLAEQAQQEGKSCGVDWFTGGSYGNCASGLNCMLSFPGTSGKCVAGKSRGERCDMWGSFGYVHSACGSNLTCTPPPASHGMFGQHTCQQVCGSFGLDGEKLNGTCSAGQVCTRAETPCRPWAGECFMYCADAANRTSQTKQQKGGWCGAGAGMYTGTFYGECADSLVCEPDVWMPGTFWMPMMPGAPNRCQEPGKKVGEQCSANGVAGSINGDCGHSLACVAPLGKSTASKTCQQMCGVSWGASNLTQKVSGACSAGKSCSCKASMPCHDETGECYMYCC